MTVPPVNHPVNQTPAGGFEIQLLPADRPAGRDKAAESTDPLLATAVTLPTPGYDGLGAMARALVEEFAMLGWPRERIARMFQLPKFVAAHAVYRARGPQFVAALIRDVMGDPQAKEG